MGLDALNTNGITTKIYYLIRDRATVSPKEPLRRIRRSRLLLFVVVQLLGFGATMAITQTIGMSGFPVVSSSLNSLADCDIASCHRISYHHLAAHTTTHNNHPEAPVYRGGIGGP